MHGNKNAFVAGLFILASLALGAIVLILIHGHGMGPVREYEASFKLGDDLGGLAIGDDVRVGGVKAGSVRGVRLHHLDARDASILVKFSLPDHAALHENAIVRAQSSLTGPTNLNVESIGAGRLLKDGEILAGLPDPKSALLASLSRSGTGIEAVIEAVKTQTVPKVNETVASFKQTADSGTTLVRHLNDKLDPIVEKYDGVTKNAGEALAQVRDLVGDTKTDFRGTMKNLNDATGIIREKLPGIAEQVSGALTKIDAAVVSAKSALEDVQKTVAHTRDVSQTLRSVVVGNQGKLEAIVTGLKATSDNLKSTSIEVRRSPWRLLYKPTPEEMGNLNLYDTTRQFAEGANHLSDAATALRDALRDPNTDKAQLQKLINQLDETFHGFHQVENKLWTAVKE